MSNEELWQRTKQESHTLRKSATNINHLSLECNLQGARRNTDRKLRGGEKSRTSWDYLNEIVSSLVESFSGSEALYAEVRVKGIE